MATVLRVLNNNLVLCTGDDGRQFIVMGRGLGFHKKLGDEIDPHDPAVSQRFVPWKDQGLSSLVDQLASIDSDMLVAVDAAVGGLAGVGQLSPRARQALVVAIADHLDGAIERQRQGCALAYPLQWEVQQLYPAEREAAGVILARVSEKLGCEIDPAEVTPVAMHLVNAQFMTQDMDAVAQMTTKISQVVELVCLALDIRMEDHPVDVARFVAHLRYLFVRLHDGTAVAVAQPSMDLLPVLAQQVPQAVKIARQVQTALAMGQTQIGDHEVAYLALHISRLAS